MKTDRTLALAAVVFILLAPVAHAGQEDVSKRSFAAVMVGAYFPESPDLDGGVALLLAYGSMVNRHVGLQVDFGGFSTADNHDGDVTTEWVAASIRLAVPAGFIEPYALAGAGVDYKGVPGVPLHAAFGADLTFGRILIGMEARQVWLQGDSRDYDGLMVMTKVNFRY